MSEQDGVDSPDRIWADDLLHRRHEADLLIGYIESVYARPEHNQNRAYTIAIDASYGEGKTFFLRRLARQLKMRHPVAFVDAWADDLSDEPLTALAATLKCALEPLLGDPDLHSRWSTFLSKTGRVARIAGAGLLRRGLGMLLTGAAVDAAEHVFDEVAESVKSAVDDRLGETSSGLVDDVATAAGERREETMAARVQAFEEGRRAVEEMKESLGSIVAALPAKGLRPPICILVDELDRCRPTYAIKLLEEIKHLFDVPGLVFVFGLHRDQLAHSVSGAYGASFDGSAYLRRFLNRRYELATPALKPLVEQLWNKYQLQESNFQYPRIVTAGTRNVQAIPPSKLISTFMECCGLTARDALEVIDILQTSAVVAAPRPLELAYLMALIVMNLKKSTNLPAVRDFPWQFYTPNDEGVFQASPVESYIQQLHIKALSSEDELRRAYNEPSTEYTTGVVFELRSQRAGGRLGLPQNYRQLLTTVARFTSSGPEHGQDSGAGAEGMGEIE